MDIKTCEQFVLTELEAERKANEALREQVGKLRAEKGELERKLAELNDDVHKHIVKRGIDDVVSNSYASITSRSEHADFEGWFSDVFRGVKAPGVDRQALKAFTEAAFREYYREMAE